MVSLTGLFLISLQVFALQSAKITPVQHVELIPEMATSFTARRASRAVESHKLVNDLFSSLLAVPNKTEQIVAVKYKHSSFETSDTGCTYFLTHLYVV